MNYEIWLSEPFTLGPSEEDSLTNWLVGFISQIYYNRCSIEKAIELIGELEQLSNTPGALPVIRDDPGFYRWVKDLFKIYYRLEATPEMILALELFEFKENNGST